MKSFWQWSCIFLGSFIVSGCAVGPMTSHETARTVGKGKFEGLGGLGQSGYFAKGHFGVTRRLDLGLELETLTFGARAKGTIFRQKNGWSVASAFGFGGGSDNRYYYVDGIASYFLGHWEPYGTLRYISGKADLTELRSREDATSLSFTTRKADFSYFQLMGGTRYWIDKNWLLSVEAATFLPVSTDFEVRDMLILSAAAGYRFR